MMNCHFLQSGYSVALTMYGTHGMRSFLYQFLNRKCCDEHFIISKKLKRKFCDLFQGIIYKKIISAGNMIADRDYFFIIVSSLKNK